MEYFWLRISLKSQLESCDRETHTEMGNSNNFTVKRVFGMSQYCNWNDSLFMSHSKESRYAWACDVIACWSSEAPVAIVVQLEGL